MDLSALQLVPLFLLSLFRVGGMMVFAPLFGSARIPKRVRVMLALVLAVGMMPCVSVPRNLPTTMWGMTVGIGCEIVIGIVMGQIMSMVFIAVQWAGEMIGQQMGFSLGEMIDPQFGASSSVIGDTYFMLATTIFLLLRGHHAMLNGLARSFSAIPPMSAGMDGRMLASVAGLMQTATVLAIQLAAPMLVTMLVVDLILGFLGKTIPQLNIMTAGLSLRSVVGMLVLIVGLVLTSDVMKHAVLDSIWDVTRAWNGAK